MIDQVLPFAQISLDNPVFRYAVRTIRWVRGIEQFKNQSRNIIVLMVLLAFAWWLLLVWVNWADCGSYWCAHTGGEIVLSITAFVSIAGAVLLDFICMVTSLNSIGMEFTRGRWDLLRLTPLRPDAIIGAKHVITQIRSWRAFMALLGARIATVLLALAQAFVLPAVFDYYNPLADLGEFFVTEPFLSTFVLVNIVIFTVVYLIEPFWRMRAMTALGISLSARFRNLTTASLVALAAIGLVWLSQVVIMGFIIWLMISFLSSMFVGVSSEVLPVLCVTTFCAGTGFVIYWYYRSLRATSLNRAVQFAFTEA